MCVVGQMYANLFCIFIGVNEFLKDSKSDSESASVVDCWGSVCLSFCFKDIALCRAL